MLLSALLPGLGHTAAGLPLRGLAACVLFAACWLGAAYRLAFAPLPVLDTPFLALAAAAAAVYLITFADLAFWFWRLRRGARSPLKERRLRAGMAAWAALDAATAREELRQALKLDPTDVEAHLYLASIQARTGQTRQARRSLRLCKRYDLRAKWAWEISREAARLAPKPAAAKGAK